jgi:UDPglucose--hexose-1-phosphate uridylyltransferase
MKTTGDEPHIPGAPDRTTSAETRLVWNPFLGEYTGFAPSRMQRRELTEDCPFCADLTDGHVPPGTEAWIRPNDFPALVPPAGECYVVIYSSEHERAFADLSTADVSRIIGLWQELYRDLSRRYSAVMSWETSGAEIGQTQRHPHGQTFGVSVMPDYLARELHAVHKALDAGEECPFCAEVRMELEGPRLVFSGDYWAGFVPPYARYPYQVRLTPRQHFSAVTGFANAGPVAAELAANLLRLVRAYDCLYNGQMPYMLALHQLADPEFHFHFEVLPVGRAPGKLKLAASSEMAWGFWMNDSLPEEKAAELRTMLEQVRL